jgi:glutamate carboxypeptidase
VTGSELRAIASGFVDAYLRDLEHFVNMDSGTHDEKLVQQAGEFAAQRFRELGCAIEWVSSPDMAIADSYIARLTGGDARKVVLLGHHDTVYPAGTTTQRPFRRESGRAYGPGVMDMKGGILLGVFALRVLLQTGGAGLPRVVFIGNPDEEIGSPTSRSLIERETQDADLVLVLEPGREPGSIQTIRKGVGMYELVVRGRSSHAGSRPEDGRSAVLELAHKTLALHGLTNLATGTTVNVGVVQGGTRRNVVPEHAEAMIDLRVSTAAAASDADRAIREIAARSTVPDVEAVVTGGINRPPMEKTAQTERALDVGRALVGELGLEFLETSSGGGSDGNFTAALGIPTLDGLGPVGRNAHSPDEWLDTSNLAERIALVAGLTARAPARAG